MAFSLFGKKPQPAPAKPAANRAPASAAARPAPSPPAERQPAPAAAAPREELESLDFTAPGSIEAAEDQPSSIELNVGTPQTHPVVEEAAILYANGQDDVALASLEGALASGSLGAASDQAWAMLFDLYQLMGKREAFEQRAVDYSVQFEKSPPTWVEPQRQPANPALATGGQAYVAFIGRLGEGADKQIKQLERMAGKNPMARVEFTKVQEIDAAGAAALLKALKAARKAKCELIMMGAETFAELLSRKLEPGKREAEETWLLLLELYQHMDCQDPFEEWALQYAITFEVSPPSWENRAPSKKPALAAQPEAQGEPNVFALTGEMYGAGSDAFQRLIDFASGHDSVVIDCTALKRMDFVSAGMFLNTLTNLQAMGRTALIRCANHMLCALFGVLGINQVAQIERRKF